MKIIIKYFTLLIFLGANLSFAQNYSIKFYGNSDPLIDRIRILVDDPTNGFPGPPVDVGEFDFTIEFWMKAISDSNTAPEISAGDNENWKNGNVIIDRDRFNAGRKFGISIGGGKIAFGVTSENNISKTIFGTSIVTNNNWNHIAVQRSVSGLMEIYVNGILEASEPGPAGDVSYPDDATLCNECVYDNFIFIGGKKYNNALNFFSYNGFIDELHISSYIRYNGNFTVPEVSFIPDCYTLALYHFDEGSGIVTNDIAGIAGGPVPGSLFVGGDPAGPEWSTDFALPVELLFFSGDVRERNIKLWWTTGSEVNNLGFDLERFSEENNSWYKLSFISGAGTTNYPVNYSFEDKFLNSGLYSYRLKQIDYNGHFKYYNLPQDVEIGSPVKFNLHQNFPNPFNPVTNVMFDIPFDGNLSVNVYDVSGKLIEVLYNGFLEGGFHNLTFSGNGLASGVYFLNLNFNSPGKQFSKSIKMLLTK